MSCGVGFICNIYGIRSNEIVKWGIESVKNLTHRGAIGADGKTGDGAGILIEISKEFFLKEIKRLNFRISDIENLAVGFFFLYSDIEWRIEEIFKKYHLKIIGWRDVPTNDIALGNSALLTKPKIRQIFIDTENIVESIKEQTLYLARREIERSFAKDVYISSLSSKVIVYKGMLIAPQLDRFYPDLLREDLESSFCIFHQRFSTNTLPDWTLAQPLRILAHNGEINTIQGNRNWMNIIEHEVEKDIFNNESLIPLLSHEESDSASLDRIAELLILSGFPPEHAINMCIPPIWENAEFDEEQKAFFEFQSLKMKPWDGPAAIVLTDGSSIVAHLDRNGLRPLRYTLYDDGLLSVGSEVGLIDISHKNIKQTGRLGPGDTLSADLKGKIRFTKEIIDDLTKRRPYKEWIDKYLIKIKCEKIGNPSEDLEITRKQIAFGYTSEEIETSIKEMAEKGKELNFSMGDDTPIPPLSEKPQLLFRYFRQRFSQVTNPPIDSLRERIVMSLKMNLGYKRNFLIEDEGHARRLQIESPFLVEEQIKEIESQRYIKVKKISITYEKNLSLSAALKKLEIDILNAVKEGYEIVILTDKDISKDRIAIPSLLAISASFCCLRKEKMANKASLIIETAEARDAHHFACLIGYGASAVYPYLSIQTIYQLCRNGTINVPYEKAVLNYKKAIEDSLLKIMSKMGISTLNSYHGAQLFDIVFLNQDFVDRYFRGSKSLIESDGLIEIEESLIKRHNTAFLTDVPTLDIGGDLRHRKEGQWHAWSIPLVIAFNKFIKSKDYKDFKDFSLIADGRPVFIRHLLDYKKGKPLPIEEVEPEESILKRFVTGAMSIGALSPEAHETIAEACNRLGIKSNSGEGGEDPIRYGTIKNSSIKQIASGRFGVTPAYLASAQELEIKIAQGAKPGEGGHLPKEKVTDYIAKLRFCVPNILLISPPPHHDIYSIEDLAQLINDLKEANPSAKICVKLVSEAGIGTVATGVAKAYADIIQISGCEGGTGAASITSIKNSGNYWELGLLETQRVLMENGLRERVLLRVDGCLRTGKDVIIAAILGAEEFGFGTATMIAAGCVMARQCHLNTCPKGITTQDERLRRRFAGKVEDIMFYFRTLAKEIREILAEMGFKRLDDIIGDTSLLTSRTFNEEFSSIKRIRLDSFFEEYPYGKPKKWGSKRNDNPFQTDEKILNDLIPYIQKSEPVKKEYDIRNTQRSIPVKINYFISKRYGDIGLPEDTIKLVFKGIAGQSFGAFNHKGVSITLIGVANDYVGKGMFGGKIVIRPFYLSNSHENVIVGNTVLYGATGGEFYGAGKAGERFCVRNSGATAVIEGVGHHLCEYMVRGNVVVLGNFGFNIGAGMKGGTIYILDEFEKLKERINNDYVKISLLKEQETSFVKSMIEKHFNYTESSRAFDILNNFDNYKEYFKKVIPVESIE
jgi:glutamate synthase (NADPH/NADH) large chain